LLRQFPHFFRSFEFPVNIRDIAFFSRADGADNRQLPFLVNPVHHAVRSKLMFPVAFKRSTQRRSVFVGLSVNVADGNTINTAATAGPSANLFGRVILPLAAEHLKKVY
jgi:hypothetical protein